MNEKQMDNNWFVDKRINGVREWWFFWWWDS